MGHLKDIRILDLTSRLPGPLATNQLARLGASVTKLEWTDAPDPFYQGDSEGDPIFRLWYDNFNSNKTLKRLDFESFDPSFFDDFDLIIYSPKTLFIHLKKDIQTFFLKNVNE